MIRRGRELSWESGGDGRRGQHQDPALASAGDRVAADLVAVHLGQVALQHDHVAAGDAGGVKGLLEGRPEQAACQGEAGGNSVTGARLSSRVMVWDPGNRRFRRYDCSEA
jgi:hypothetical protein